MKLDRDKRVEARKRKGYERRKKQRLGGGGCSDSYMGQALSDLQSL